MYNAYNITVSEAEEVEEPVNLDEVKDWLNIDFADKDDLLTAMIKGARKTVEGITSLSLVEKTVTMDVETTCAEIAYLPYTKGVSELSVKRLSDSDEETTLANGTSYFIRGNGLRLTAGGRYAVSYKTVIGDVPEDIKEAIKMEVAERFANRGENSGELSKSALNKLQPHIVQWL